MALDLNIASFEDVSLEVYKDILGATAGTNPDMALQVFIQALQGLGIPAVYPSETLAFSSGAAALSVSTASPIQRMTLTQNSTITLSNETQDKILEFRILHTGGPWTLTIIGQTATDDLDPSVASGGTDYWTSVSNGTNREWHNAGEPDAIA